MQPFRFWQWARLAVVGLLAGEMGSGGSFNFPGTFQQHGGSSGPFPSGGLPHIDPAILGALIAVIILAAVVLGLLLMYIGSVMRFILFDSVLAKECHIRQGWSRRQTAGWKLFLWHVGLTFVTFAVMIVLIGIPAGLALALGWFKAPREHLLGLILGGIILFFVFMIFAVAVAVVHVLTKDFVVPQMALEGIGAVEGWRRLWSMIQAEKGGYAVYVGMKIVLAMGAAIIIGLASLIVGLLFAVPTVLLGIVAIVTGKTAGLTWNALTITIAVVVGCILLALLMYLMSLIAVPAIVFFPAYSIYFFAARYRPLSLVLYPPPPPAAVWVPSGTPPQEPPPLAPIPAPG